MFTNIIVAVLLFVLTLLSAYIIWYVVRGRHLRERDAARQKAKAKRDDVPAKPTKHPRKGKWGVEKDSYCYPEMNDVMGYEFISVVKIDEELRKDKKDGPGSVPAGDTDESVKNWDKSQGIGLTSTPDSDTGKQIRDNDQDETFPDSNAEGNSPEKIEEDQPDASAENSGYVDFSQAELDYFTENGGNWSDNDDVNNSIFNNDEEIRLAMDSNADIFEESGDDQENISRIHREREQLAGFDLLQKRFEERNTDGKDSIGASIIRELMEKETEDNKETAS